MFSYLCAKKKYAFSLVNLKWDGENIDKMKNVFLSIHQTIWRLSIHWFLPILQICMIDSYQFPKRIHKHIAAAAQVQISQCHSNDQNVVIYFQHERHLHCEVVNHSKCIFEMEMVEMASEKAKNLKFISTHKQQNSRDTSLTNFVSWIYKSFHLSPHHNHLRLSIHHFNFELCAKQSSRTTQYSRQQQQKKNSFHCLLTTKNEQQQENNIEEKNQWLLMHVMDSLGEFYSFRRRCVLTYLINITEKMNEMFLFNSLFVRVWVKE